MFHRSQTMGSMRDKVSKLQNAAFSKRGRTYAAAVALIVAFFMLLAIAQQGGSKDVKSIPSRFLFSAGTFSVASIALGLCRLRAVICCTTRMYTWTQRPCYYVFNTSVDIIHPLRIFNFNSQSLQCLLELHSCVRSWCQETRQQ